MWILFAFEDYCHVWCATTRLVEIYRYFWGKSVNFHEVTPLSLLRRLYTLYSLPLIPEMPFYLFISPEDITKLSAFMMFVGSVCFYIYKLLLNYILFCFRNIVAFYIYVNLLCLQTTMDSLFSHWTCCTNWCYILPLLHLSRLFIRFVTFVPPKPEMFNLFCCLYACHCLEHMYCATVATV